jgi:hypothetical protein
MKKIILIISLITVLNSCYKEVDLTNNIANGSLDLSSAKIKNNENGEGEFIFGKKLENPYSVANMKIALDKYKQKYSNGSVFEIRATHKYLRFLPADRTEYDKLKEVEGLDLYEIPLDYEIIKSGSSYHDPTLPEESVSWQYASVPIDFQNSLNIKTEVLDLLYIPELDDKLLDIDNNLIHEEEVINLLNISFVGTNNAEDTVSLKKVNANAKWNPSGCIKVFDDRVGGLIGLFHVKVKARRWFVTDWDYTDANGCYNISHGFNGKVNYSIYYETSQFDVRSGTWGQAWLNGPKLEASWSENINSGMQKYYATVFRGAARYHHNDIGDLKRPCNLFKLKYCAYDGSNDEANGDFNSYAAGLGVLGVIPDIRIWRFNPSGSEKTSVGLFGTTVHETAHASHLELMNAGPIQFWQVDKIIVESWARAAQWFLTKKEYNSLGIATMGDPGLHSNLDHAFTTQWWKEGEDLPNHTPLFIDLVDNHNQATKTISGADLPSNKCPVMGVFDGANCYCGSPPSGESAFLLGDNFFYTPVGASGCPLSGSFFDGANCFLSATNATTIPFIWDNNWYVTVAGDPNFPFDEISDFTLGQIESNFLKHVYGINSLKEKVKINKPWYISNRAIDIYFNTFQ